MNRPFARRPFEALLCGLLSFLLATAAAAQTPMPQTASKDASAKNDSADINPHNLFRLARNEFTHGQYEKAIAHFQQLIYPLKLTSEEDLIEARRLLGIAYYLTQQREKAINEFTKLLFLKPDYKLDPFYVTPPIIEFFETIRAELKPQLDALLAVKHEQEAERRRQLATHKNQPFERERIEYRHRNVAIAFLPFGIGQYQNNTNRLGAFFLTSQLSFLGANITFGAISSGLANRYRNKVAAFKAVNGGPYPAADLTRYNNIVRGFAISSYVALGAFAVLWMVGAIEARVRFQPVDVRVFRETVNSDGVAVPLEATPPR